MQIANIYPIKNQAFYKKEKVVMILAHLLQKGLYKEGPINKDSYVIMDNGMFEGSMVSSQLIDLIQLAEKAPFHVDEIVIPDAMFNMKATIDLFEQNIQTIKEYQHKYRFMFVAQARTVDELEHICKYINEQPYNLCLGIPKKCIVARDSALMRRIYKASKHPVHLLGLRESFASLKGVAKLVRSCDSAQICIMAKYINSMKDAFNQDTVMEFVRDDNMVIDLEEDRINYNDLGLMLALLNHGVKSYGLL